MTSLFFILSFMFAGGASAGDARLRPFKLAYGGYDREYHVYSPAGLEKGKKYPLVFALHGGGGTARGMRRLTFKKFEELAEKDKFIIVYPQGVEKNWNDGRGDSTRKAQRENIDDAGFLLAAAEKTAAAYPADLRNLFFTGMSNGAFMSSAMACLHADRVRAIAPVAGSISENLARYCKPSGPVPVLMMNGDKDRLVHWEGGDVTGPFGRRKFGKALAVLSALDFWLKAGACGKDKPTLEKLDAADDGTSSERTTYADCAPGTEVSLIKISGGGHTWPGGLSYLPEALIGRTSRDFNACEESWKFFKRHVKK